MGHSWQFALTAVFLEGIVFVLLTLTNVRKWIVDALPLSLKYAVGAGIGLIIAFLGFQNAGIVGQGPTLVTLAFKLPDGSFSGTALSSLTSGRGTFTMTFSSYELVPADVQQALLKAYEEAANEEE